ncbi:Acyl-coenzyme A:6-aminopenicillanic acid acyl-transferase [Streptomyces sp. yr375]|uniref:C45 family autoproteolytic acyltransferase/hydolase n=1 Tax=Streptomyces sp. yr375 TaxID=1761906 RepID=UPI0008B99F68|nr:C45 family peptidase [Streptomyces sp. yr375]SES04697.1 Acyl-coenzyme A:6-aminopenicillanic acid acyl-transferase [Streptomyces sp. yr375]
MTGGAGIPLVPVHGDPFAAGRAHGERLAAPLRAFLGDSLARLGRVMEPPVTLAGLLPAIAAHRASVAAAAPELAEEVRGLAAGAGLDESEAWLLQLRREIMGYRRVPVPTTGDCTTYARTGPAADGHPVLAQSVDLNGDLDDHIAVLDVARAGTKRRSLVLSFGGLLGYLGLNSDGLAVGINLVLGGDWTYEGLSPYLAVRHLLDTAGSVDEALAVLSDLPLTSSRVLTLCDARRAVWVEHLEGEYRTREAATLVHTNHYLHPDFTAADQINIFARNSSLRRLDAATAGLAALPVDADPEKHFAVLAEPPIRVPDSGDIRRERTVAAVVMLPTRGELHVRRGDPALSTTEVFRL